MLYSYSFLSFVFINKYPVVENRKNQQTGVLSGFDIQRGLKRENSVSMLPYPNEMCVCILCLMKNVTN